MTPAIAKSNRRAVPVHRHPQGGPTPTLDGGNRILSRFQWSDLPGSGPNRVPSPTGDPALESIRIGVLDSVDLKHSASQLRHNVFREELAWLSPTENGLDQDILDDFSVGISACRGDEVLSFLRLTPWARPWMVDIFFPYLLDHGIELPRSSDSAEISRLCIRDTERDARYKTPFGTAGISLFMYRELFQVCSVLGVRHLYFVTSTRVARLIGLQGFPLRCLATHGNRRNDNQVLCHLDWQLFLHQSNRDELVRWFEGK